MTWRKQGPERTAAMSEQPRYRVRPVVTPLPSRAAADDAAAAGVASGSAAIPGTPASKTASVGAGTSAVATSPVPAPSDPFIRPPAEDDDGYDPFSDRPPAPEPTFQEDPWR